MATRPPTRMVTRDLDGAEVEISLGDGLVLRRGLIRIDLPADAGLDVLRWLLWHGLHGRWAPKIETMRGTGDRPS